MHACSFTHVQAFITHPGTQANQDLRIQIQPKYDFDRATIATICDVSYVASAGGGTATMESVVVCSITPCVQKGWSIHTFPSSAPHSSSIMPLRDLYWGWLCARIGLKKRRLTQPCNGVENLVYSIRGFIPDKRIKYPRSGRCLANPFSRTTPLSFKHLIVLFIMISE